MIMVTEKERREMKQDLPIKWEGDGGVRLLLVHQKDLKQLRRILMRKQDLMLKKKTMKHLVAVNYLWMTNFVDLMKKRLKSHEY